jgi:hypothetical protein
MARIKKFTFLAGDFSSLFLVLFDFDLISEG